MKPEELRIGNLLNYYGQEVIVLSVSRDRADFGYYPDSVGFERLFKPTDGPSDIPKPIPLSPEWLEKLGFEQYNEGFWRIGNSDGWFLTSDGELAKSLSESEFYIRCESVHQLQNLIYSLTGTELQLKQ